MAMSEKANLSRVGLCTLSSCADEGIQYTQFVTSLSSWGSNKIQQKHRWTLGHLGLYLANVERTVVSNPIGVGTLKSLFIAGSLPQQFIGLESRVARAVLSPSG